MGSLQELKKDIAASLYLKPAGPNEIMDRDFLRNKSPWGIKILLYQMEQDKWIYHKGGKYYTYKSFAESPEMDDYELHGL